MTRIRVLRLPIISVLLLTVAVFLTGCNRQTSSLDTIHIKYWTFPLWYGITGNEKNGSPEDWPKMVARKFEASHPGVKIDTEVLTWQGGNQKIDLSVLSGTYPDVCYLSATNIAKYVNQGVLEPIDPYLTSFDRSDITPSILDACKINGKTYLWPWICNTLVVAINRDIFRERHVEYLIPKGPDRSWTTDQFLKAAKACTFDRDGDGRIDVYGYPLYGIPVSIEYYMLSIVLGHGAKLYNDDHTAFTLNSPEGRRGMQFLLDLQDQYKVSPPGAAGVQYDSIFQMFQFEESAMVTSGSGIVRALQTAAAKGQSEKFDVVLVQPPHYPGKKCSTMLSLGGYMVFKQKDKKKRDMVMEFARYLTNAEQSQALVAMGQLPARKSAGDLYPGDEDMKTVTRMVPMARMYHTVMIPEMAGVLNNTYQQIFSHTATVSQALDNAEKRADALFMRDREERGASKR